MRLQNKRFFYIEDNLLNRAVTQMILEREGAKMGFERWGANAVAELQRFAPVDMILLDLMFPRNISGYDIFDEIRTLSEFAHVPIVAVSASEPSIEIPKTRARGFAGYIAKPINIHTFADKLISILDGQAVWA